MWFLFGKTICEISKALVLSDTLRRVTFVVGRLMKALLSPLAVSGQFRSHYSSQFRSDLDRLALQALTRRSPYEPSSTDYHQVNRGAAGESERTLIRRRK